MPALQELDCAVQEVATVTPYVESDVEDAKVPGAHGVHVRSPVVEAGAE